MPSTAIEYGPFKAGPEPSPAPEISVRTPVFLSTRTTWETPVVMPSSAVTTFPFRSNAMSSGLSRLGAPSGDRLLVKVPWLSEVANLITSPWPHGSGPSTSSLTNASRPGHAVGRLADTAEPVWARAGLSIPPPSPTASAEPAPRSIVLPHHSKRRSRFISPPRSPAVARFCAMYRGYAGARAVGSRGQAGVVTHASPSRRTASPVR